MKRQAFSSACRMCYIKEDQEGKHKGATGFDMFRKLPRAGEDEHRSNGLTTLTATDKVNVFRGISTGACAKQMAA